MIDLLLASKGWPQVILVIGGMFAILIVLIIIYSKIDEKTKVEEKTEGCGWPIFVVIIVCIVAILMNIKSCKGCSSGGHSYDSIEYQHLRE